MKPLTTANEAKQLGRRILDAEGAMLRSLDVTGPTSARLRLSVQDKHRGFDWIDMTFEINGMNDARLVDDKTLGLINTDDGITMLFEDSVWGIGIGRYRSLEALKSSPLFIIGTSLKYEEAPFSG